MFTKNSIYQRLLISINSKILFYERKIDSFKKKNDN